MSDSPQPPATHQSDDASMEDILASIRSMIAEESAEPAAPSASAGLEVAKARSVARDIPEPVAVLEAAPEPESSSATPHDVGGEQETDHASEPDPVASLFEPPLTAVEDVAIPEIESVLPVPAPAVVAETVTPEPDEHIAELDTLAEPVSAPRDIAETEDIDLVKSLMAELTAEPEPEAETKGAPEPDDTLDVLMDDLIDQAIADEEALAIPDAAFEAPASGPVPDTTTSDLQDADDRGGMATGGEVISLAAIARRADADARALSGDPEPAEPDPLPEPEPAPAQLLPEIEPSPEPQPEPLTPADLETEVMARTAPLEDIVARDVETEAGSAFAELNRMVEEKATFEERGPRIGDLVQEALKPMLKEWLDENLQGIVERAVSKEVARIAGQK